MSVSPQRGLKRGLDFESENKELRKKIRELEQETEEKKQQKHPHDDKAALLSEEPPATATAGDEGDDTCPVCIEPAVRRGGKALLSCGSCGVQVHLSCAQQLFKAPQRCACPACRKPMIGMEMLVVKWRILIGKLWYRNSPLLSDKGTEFVEKGQVVTGVLACRDGLEWVQDKKGFLPMNTAEGVPLVKRCKDTRMFSDDSRCTACGWEIDPDDGCQCQLHPGESGEAGESEANMNDEESDLLSREPSITASTQS
ncbi:unnamed protein product [Polarella glacialis]|uniref:RING-type domain-containing protein n=1 Tax=Polarella glacialis TaxID=89957 RepID=A0A813D7E4_POLGL|nr:unnamed protein product [Polarella glacialis]CAE8680673.1 unnamed protein product [Polarella glacialis]